MHFKKQASDDEDNEIEIVEPKTDTITIDSDNDDDTPSTSTQQKAMMKIVSVTSAAPKKEVIENQTDIDVAAFSSTILASLLEVDIHEGSGDPKAISPGQKKQPRKKTTNKPNPALLQLERQRMEELKRSDVKLKKKCVVKLRRAEDEFEVARQWMDRFRQRDQDAQGDATKITDTAEASPAKAPSEIDLEESAKNSPPNNDHQPMEIEIQLNTLAPELQEKEITSKEKESEDLKLKESDKQPLPDDKNKDKPVKKEKIGEMLKTAIKIKISQKAQTGGEVKTEEKRLTEEREKAVTAEQNKAVGEEGQVDKAISENISEKDSPDEKKKESASQTEKLAEKDKTEQKKKKEKVDGTEVIEEEDPDQESSKEKEPPASEKERAIDEDESLTDKIPESYQSDEKDKKAPTETVSEAPTEAAAPLEADPSPDADKVVPQESIFQNEELTKQDPAADLLEAMDTSTDNGKSLAGELVEGMDVIELDEPPKELLDCGIDEVISMDGIELSCATEELMKALASSPSALTSENATLDATDLNADELIETLPLETTEPPEILLKEDDNGETGNSEAPIINSGENGGTDQEEAGEATAPEDVAATGHIQG
ncbi:neurofilament heavy polypeptide-like [Drosophila serrata]|uniref:neurofilament heavy polypeptide-like n=1 Tax=Drosophila serrata TaxID=7274 RepID=UPI000A1D0A1F|nr:neurofilament heavy polypeptide-like [Drosophila serrata]